VPGRSVLDWLDGACDVDGAHVRSGSVGPTLSGRFCSAARRRMVGFTVAYPAGFGLAMRSH
jgi:hypothetical protein